MQLTAQSDAVADVHSRGMKDGVSMSRRGDAGEISASSSHEDKDNLTTPNRFSLTEKVIPLGAEEVGYMDEEEDASAADFSSLSENPLPEGRMGSNEMVISEHTAASSDDEESIEALMRLHSKTMRVLLLRQKREKKEMAEKINFGRFYFSPHQ